MIPGKPGFRPGCVLFARIGGNAEFGRPAISPPVSSGRSTRFAGRLTDSSRASRRSRRSSRSKPIGSSAYGRTSTRDSQRERTCAGALSGLSLRQVRSIVLTLAAERHVLAAAVSRTKMPRAVGRRRWARRRGQNDPSPSNPARRVPAGKRTISNWGRRGGQLIQCRQIWDGHERTADTALRPCRPRCWRHCISCPPGGPIWRWSAFPQARAAPDCWVKDRSCRDGGATRYVAHGARHLRSRTAALPARAASRRPTSIRCWRT